MDSCGRHNGIINPEESGNFDPITNAAPTNERTGDRPTKSNPFGFLALPRATPSLRGGEGERGRGSCNKLCLVRGRRNICQRGEREEQRASHKGELIKRLNFQEWPSVRPSVHSFVRKAIEISVLSRLTSSRLARFFSGRGRQAGNERGFHARQYKGTVALPPPGPRRPASHLPRGSGDDAKSVEADFEFFSKKMDGEATVQVATLAGAALPTERVGRDGNTRNT